jgi:MFS superfamily sulfate permease-like transporter
MITILAIILTDLLTGVLLGLAVGVFVILYRSYMNSHWLDIRDNDDAEPGHLVQLRLADQVSFLSRGAILRQLSEIPSGSRVVIDMSRTVSIDHDVLEIIDDFVAAATSRSLDVSIIPTTPLPSESAALDAA